MLWDASETNTYNQNKMLKFNNPIGKKIVKIARSRGRRINFSFKSDSIHLTYTQIRKEKIVIKNINKNRELQIISFCVRYCVNNFNGK